MNRIFGDFIYGEGPRANCYWDTTCDIPTVPSLDRSLRVDVAIIGAGFTGLNAAKVLAEKGAAVAILDTHAPGWGASGRNGGFCCLGGGKAGDAFLDAKFGKDERLRWRSTEKAAVGYVADFLKEHKVDAGVHSNGETVLAHRARDARAFDDEMSSVKENYGVEPTAHSSKELRDQGLSAGFHGGMTIPIGFALNPRVYIGALVAHVLHVGASVFQDAQVQRLAREGSQWRLEAGNHHVLADDVIVATNGYSSEDIPDWLAGRYMPTQSSVGVTRPMTRSELEAQGWMSHQMCFDSRNLLHYFHLLPDNRMLFGMRGGLGGTPASDTRAQVRLIRDFKQMFPAWGAVELTNLWSGMVCIARGQMPFVGQVPKAPGLWAALGYHGNGVAMGSYAGHLIGHAVLIRKVDNIPLAMSSPLTKFPLGRWRRGLMPPVYGALAVGDL